MRRCYLVCYDIREPRRLRRVHKLLKGYGEPWQYSVFYCVLADIDRVRLEQDLRGLIDLRADEVLILDLGSNADAVRDNLTILGPLRPPTPTGIVVI
jgi:CRISPR-associated protein Cas2